MSDQTPCWKFFDVVFSNETNPVKKWFLKELSVQERSDLVDLLTNLSKQTKTAWVSGDYRVMPSLGAGIGEFKIPGAQGIPVRLIGFKDPDPTILKFTFLIGCRHKSDRYIPAEALDTAKQRKKDLDKGRSTTNETKIFEFYKEAEER